MIVTLGELATLLDAELLSGDAATVITGFASLKEALAGDLSFYHDTRYQDQMSKTEASAVLVPKGWTADTGKVATLAVADPSRAFDKVVDAYGVAANVFEPGIHPTAVVSPSIAARAAHLSIGANAVIEDSAEIGDGVSIGSGCYVGALTSIGAGSLLYANVTIQKACRVGRNVIIHPGAVIGADGFGYEFEQGRHRKVRQSGIVQIDDDVEIGANTTIDRARFGRTQIGMGTKIDNQVQIGHNVVIGKHCIIVAGTGIAGSARIGDYVVIAAQCGVAGHVSIGSGCTLGARSGVTKDIPPGRAQYMGFPALPVMEERRRLAAIKRLPELRARVKQLEAMIGNDAGESETE
jgi:UDP-3-O-[3-hydroxymyristoyl] glucosamine N-acyltransferase